MIILIKGDGANRPLCFYRISGMKILFFLFFISFSISAQKATPSSSIKFLALGDSYTIGQSVQESERWPVQLMDSLQKKGLLCQDPKIVAMTGWRTDDLEKAIEQSHLSNDYTIVSLLIGVNDYYQGKSVTDYKPAFEKLLNRAIALAGGKRSNVFVISIPDYGFTPFGESDQPEITKGIDLFNKTNKAVTVKEGVHYVEITDISRRGLKEPDLVAKDELHPSGKMYHEWIGRILENLTIVSHK